MAGLKQHIISNAIYCIYTAFIYSDFTQQMQTLPEEILLQPLHDQLKQHLQNWACTVGWRLWEWGENFNIPTPLSSDPGIYHVSTRENFSFDPTNFGHLPIAPEPHDEYSPWGYRCHTSIHHRLVFSSSDEESHMTPCESHQNHFSTNVSSPAHRSVELSSPIYHNLCNLLTPATDQFLTEAWYDDSTSTEEHFPTEPLSDDI